MKKPNRIARKGDTARTPAQSKAAPAITRRLGKLTLAYMLTKEQLHRLGSLECLGVPGETTIGNAIQSWLDFTENPNMTVEHLLILKGELDPGHYECILSNAQKARAQSAIGAFRALAAPVLARCRFGDDEHLAMLDCVRILATALGFKEEAEEAFAAAAGLRDADIANLSLGRLLSKI